MVEVHEGGLICGLTSYEATTTFELNSERRVGINQQRVGAPDRDAGWARMQDVQGMTIGYTYMAIKQNWGVRWHVKLGKSLGQGKLFNLKRKTKFTFKKLKTIKVSKYRHCHSP